jgi:hypothetical protein
LVLVRSEELLVRHARILCAAGRDDQAREYIRLALEIVRSKERSIFQPAVRRCFLTRVPLNRDILRLADERQIHAVDSLVDRA